MYFSVCFYHTIYSVKLLKQTFIVKFLQVQQESVSSGRIQWDEFDASLKVHENKSRQNDGAHDLNSKCLKTPFLDDLWQ